MRERNVELPLLKGRPKEKYIPISLIIGALVLLLLVVIASFAFTFKRKYNVHYSEKSNIDYKVYLKDNNFYNEKYLTKNKKYIASLIKNIDTDFDYSFKIDDKVDLKYTYYVVAKVEVNDSQGTNIYEKEEMLSSKKTLNADGDNFKIHEDIDIDYDKFISDGLVQDACFMNLTQIGENVVKLDDDFISKYKDIKWNEMKGLRNRIVHDYDGVEIQIIWETIKDDLPKLKKQLQAII